MASYPVFISSTTKDLAAYRKAAEEVIESFEGRFVAIRSEDWAARPDTPAEVVRQKVREVAAQGGLMVLIVALYYGSSPADEPDKSFVEIEYETAREAGMDVLVFLSEGEDLPQGARFLREPDDRWERLQAFRRRLQQEHTVEFFRDLAGFREALMQALHQWLEERAPRQPQRPTGSPDGSEPEEFDPADILSAYLAWLVREHSTLELRGLTRRAGQPLAVPLEQVFVALKADTASPTEREESRLLLEQEWREALRELLADPDLDPETRRRLRWRLLARHPYMPSLLERDRPHLFQEGRSETLSLAQAFRRFRRMVILGDPGSGKTTLARWLTLQLARARLEGRERVTVPAAAVDPEAEPYAPPLDLGPARIPILVRVADYAEARRRAREAGQSPPSLADFLGHHGWLGNYPTFGPGHPQQGEYIPPQALNRLFKDALRQGDAVVLLDGLDEITVAEDREEVVRAVEAFIRDFLPEPPGPVPEPPPVETGGNQIVVTSRIAGYHAAPLSGRLTHLTIQPLEKPAIDRFCDLWALAVHQALTPDASEEEIQQRARKEAESLKAAIHDPQRIGVRELASNPLLLTLLALVHHNAGARLPEQRVRLYQMAVESLVEVWRETGLTEDEVVHVLAPIAAHIHERYPTGLIEEGELRSLLTHHLARYRGLDLNALPPRERVALQQQVEAFLTAVREQVGLLAARGEGLYGFLHLTFQEYLAARHLVADPATAVDELLQRRHDPRWREPILLALGYISWTQGPQARQRVLQALLAADDPARDPVPQGLLLVAAALPELAQAPPAIVRQVTQGLLDLLAHRAGPGRLPSLEKDALQALKALRRAGTAREVDRTLVRALEGASRNPARAMAAALAVLEHEWFTRDLTEVLLAALPHDRTEWRWPVHLALIIAGLQAPDRLPPGRLPFRQRLLRDPALARRVAGDPDWAMLTLALYGGLGKDGAFHPRHLWWDGPLTPLLLEALAEGRDARDLVPHLRARLAGEADSWTRAHLVLALAALAAEVTGEDRSSVQEAEVALLQARAWLLSAWVRGMGAAGIRALAALAAHLAEPERQRLLQEALDAARELPEQGFLGSPRAEALAALAPHLAGHPHLLQRALDAAREIQDPYARARALADLAPHLEEPLRLQALQLALDAAREIQDPYARARALADLAPHLAGHPHLLQQALDAAREIQDSDDRARALAALAPHLAGHPHLRQQVMALLLPLRLAGRLAAALRALGRARDPESIPQAWEEATHPERGRAALARLRALGAEKGLGLTARAAAALDRALEDHPQEARGLLPLVQEPEARALPVVEAWLEHPDPEVVRHAALLLVEAGRLSARTLPLLAGLLREGPDRSRYRTYRALTRENTWTVSRLGRETVEALVDLYRAEADLLASTVLDWVLGALRHDDPVAFTAWLEAARAGDEVAQTILGRVHALTETVWPPFRQGLEEGPEPVQRALLDSLAWLLRLERLNEKMQAEAREALHRLLAAEDPEVRADAAAALGHLPHPTLQDLEALPALPLEEDPRLAAAACPALAWLARRLGEEGQARARARLQALLHHKPVAEAAAGGLARLLFAAVREKPEDFDPRPVLEELTTALQGSGVSSLAALLAAGTDDDVWENYHERVTRAARDLVTGDPDAYFDPLLTALEDALVDGVGWSRRRIVLAVTAAVAEAAPAAFAHRADPERVERLLIQATREAESFNTRRFALTALGYLRRVTPAVVEALAAAMGDVPRVQADALAAVERFRRLEGDWLPDLVPYLEHPSPAVAYAAGRLLAALGRSPHLEAEQRRAVVQALKAALTDPASHREVYVWDGRHIQFKGYLDDLLYRALRQVL